MLENARIATRLPAQELERARAFYAEKLGLADRGAAGRAGLPLRERRVWSVRIGGRFAWHLHPDGWEVDDIEATVAELRERGVEFEEVDLPGLRTVDGIAEVAGN
jgi:hypothetical protein